MMEVGPPPQFPWETIIPPGTILSLYDEAMTRYGGRKSDPTVGCIESCIGNAWNAEQYADAGGIPGGYIFGVHLLIYLARNHCFADGNKRIAWASFCYVLNYHGLTVRASAEDVEKIMNSLVVKAVNAEDVSAWVRHRIVMREAAN
jgi:death on curing protein